MNAVHEIVRLLKAGLVEENRVFSNNFFFTRRRTTTTTETTNDDLRLIRVGTIFARCAHMFINRMKNLGTLAWEALLVRPSRHTRITSALMLLCHRRRRHCVILAC